jgi:ribonuclease P protein component
MGERLPRSARLTNAAAFAAVFAHRCVGRSEHLTVSAKPGVPDLGRLGLALSRKVAARAVDRNYMKRVIREAFRCHAMHYAGMDVVVTPRRIFRRGQGKAIEAELMALAGPLANRCLASCKP